MPVAANVVSDRRTNEPSSKRRIGVFPEPATDLVNPDGFSPQFDLVHDLTCIFSVLLGQKLAKAVSLMRHRYPVFGEMDIDLRESGDVM